MGVNDDKKNNPFVSHNRAYHRVHVDAWDRCLNALEKRKNLKQRPRPSTVGCLPLYEGQNVNTTVQCSKNFMNFLFFLFIQQSTMMNAQLKMGI